MKTYRLIAIIIGGILIFTVFSFSSKSYKNINSLALADTSNNYLDGSYEGISRKPYTSENFWGHARIEVQNGSFTNISFVIRDSTNHECVDSMYGVNHYSGIPEYMQQCVEDGHGIKIYPRRLIESQDLDNVDAISGATWSYNIFISSVKEALKNAEKPSGIASVCTDIISFEAYPNPFSTDITFEYNLQIKSNVNLGFYDVQGKLIKKLVDNIQEAGQYILSYCETPASGIYFYILQVDNITSCKKLICERK